MNIIDKLYQTLQTRKNANADASYVASLYAGGAQKINAKILEEAQELADEISALEGDSGNHDIRDRLKNEAADLIFHLWVGLAHYDIEPQDIGAILESRFGTSGHEEKASRGEKT